ncbi:microcin C ABC transporter permease YejB [Lacibacterium aquatile]|uniref:Microcin C ABC transporter permease YejB n=1 Tax=Lacibacterium aquatile TaxID=1168082 RepID=A0ABW5DQ33_9PROT
MLAYIIRRLLLMIPTLFGIMVINFLVVQAAPGGPVEQTIAAFKGRDGGTLARITGGGELIGNTSAEVGKGARGLRPELIEEIKRMYGFDRPPVERFVRMMKNYATFDFGKSFFRDRKVVDLVIDKLPVSISLGLWTLLISYGISIPLGIMKAVRDGSRFDVWSSTAIVIGYSIPSFLFAVLLIILFAGGSYFQWFPLRGLVSSDFASLSLGGKIIDYFWHMALPITAMVLGSFATLTLLTKNSFIEEIGKQYVLTARAKGLTENRVLYRHIFRNAMLLVIAGFPASFIALMFTGSVLIETIFSLDGIGLLGFEAAVSRDYPVMFGTLYVFTLIGLLLHLLGDIMYTVVDPRIDFEKRHG